LFLSHGDQLETEAANSSTPSTRVPEPKASRSKSPVRTPVANAFAERWIATIRRELLDRTIIWNQHQLEQLVVDYIDHYNKHRPTAPSISNHHLGPKRRLQRSNPTSGCEIEPIRQTHQRAPKRPLTNRDAVFGPHTIGQVVRSFVQQTPCRPQ